MYHICSHSTNIGHVYNRNATPLITFAVKKYFSITEHVESSSRWPKYISSTSTCRLWVNHVINCNKHTGRTKASYKEVKLPFQWSPVFPHSQTGLGCLQCSGSCWCLPRMTLPAINNNEWNINLLFQVHNISLLWFNAIWYLKHEFHHLHIVEIHVCATCCYTLERQIWKVITTED